MTSKIVVNNIEADTGISTVTFNSNIQGNLIGNVTGNLNSTGVTTVTNLTATNITVGTAGTAITTVGVGSSVGIGSTLPQTKLGAAEGHPASVMDMSFSEQELKDEWLL